MNVWLAVVADLTQFVCGPLVRMWRRGSSPAVVPLRLALPQTEQPLALETEACSVAAKATTSPTVSALPEVTTPGTRAVLTESSHLYGRPAVIFDGALKQLTAGTIVSTFERSGRWQRVETAGAVSGWVLVDALTPLKRFAPEFIDDVIYEASSAAARAVRTIIQDEFLGGVADLPLQPEEFVSYQLQRNGIRIPWTERTQRIAGTWHRKLKGVTSVQITIYPRTNAVMEYVSGEQGHLAVVTDVAPDQSITVIGIGLIAEGGYSSLELSEADWKALAPVFISVT